jgi:hypothetical protein
VADQRSIVSVSAFSAQGARESAWRAPVELHHVSGDYLPLRRGNSPGVGQRLRALNALGGAWTRRARRWCVGGAPRDDDREGCSRRAGDRCRVRQFKLQKTTLHPLGREVIVITHTEP